MHVLLPLPLDLPRVRWYVSSLGSEEALHTAHWHGISFNMSGKHMDQVRQGWGGVAVLQLQLPQQCHKVANHTRADVDKGC